MLGLSQANWVLSAQVAIEIHHAVEMVCLAIYYLFKKGRKGFELQFAIEINHAVKNCLAICYFSEGAEGSRILCKASRLHGSPRRCWSRG